MGFVILTFIAFMLGFFTNIMALPFFLGVVYKRMIRIKLEHVLTKITSKVIFQWTFSIVVAFSLASYIIYLQHERLARYYNLKYQSTIDSLKVELKVSQIERK